MSTTMPADFAFVPKVWEDEVSAYFPKKLVFGALATPNNTLVSKPGTTINFPYFKSIGEAEEPAADESLSVDKIQDDSFSATVTEIAKAVGVRKAALMSSSQEQNRIFSEIQQQMGRVIAEKIDANLITEIEAGYTTGYTASDDLHTAKVSSILTGLVTAFGDKQDEAVALIMHSQAYLSIMTDSTAGFLQGNANDPFWNTPGFMGRLLGKALIVSDQCPQVSDVDGKKAYALYAFKPNPYGYILKQSPMMGHDYDLLNREHVFTMEQWAAVKSFHAKVSSDDKRICRMTFASAVSA